MIRSLLILSVVLLSLAGCSNQSGVAVDRAGSVTGQVLAERRAASEVIEAKEAQIEQARVICRAIRDLIAKLPVEFRANKVVENMDHLAAIYLNAEGEPLPQNRIDVARLPGDGRQAAQVASETREKLLAALENSRRKADTLKARQAATDKELDKLKKEAAQAEEDRKLLAWLKGPWWFPGIHAVAYGFGLLFQSTFWWLIILFALGVAAMFLPGFSTVLPFIKRIGLMAWDVAQWLVGWLVWALGKVTPWIGAKLYDLAEAAFDWAEKSPATTAQSKETFERAAGAKPKVAKAETALNVDP